LRLTMRSELVVLGIIACNVRGRGLEPVSGQPGNRATPNVDAVEPAARPTGEMRILVAYDMEGMAGQADWHFNESIFAEQYRRGRELLVADVNAVVTGLFAGGASSVDVVDLHGSGNPESDLPIERLDQHARLISRPVAFDPVSELPAAGAYDAVVLVAMHGRTGGGGFESHTRFPGQRVRLNGRSITETELVAYSWGRFRIPVILVTGDDRLRDELGAMQWVEYVVVKISTGPVTTTPRAVSVVHQEMLEAAKRAIHNRDAARALRVREPVHVGMTADPPLSVEMIKQIPNVRSTGDTVEFTAPDFLGAYEGVKAIGQAIDAKYVAAILDRIASDPRGKDLVRDYTDTVLTSVMLGRPFPTRPRPSRYYGYQ